MQVKRKELTLTTTRKLVNCKTKDFEKILWKISLDTINSKIKFLQESENPSHPNIIEGLSQLISILDIFLNTSSHIILKFTMQSIWKVIRF